MATNSNANPSGSTADKLQTTELAELATIAKRMKELSDNVSKRADEKVRELKSWEEKRNQLEVQMDENSAKVKTKVLLDVGGKRFATSKDTLLSHKDTYFAALLQSGKFKAEEDGAYFIDRNPKYFAIILEYLRTGKLTIGHLTDEQQANLKIELDYYQLPAEITRSRKETGSTILIDYISIIEQWASKSFGNLLWRGSTNNFSINSFHTSCDNKGPTVVIVKSAEGWIFGGYASTSWNSNSTYTESAGCFLYTITNPNKIPPTKYVCVSSSHALYGDRNLGPTFGAGQDLRIYSAGNSRLDVNFNFPHSYAENNMLGFRYFTNNTFTGNATSTVLEVEVFEMK